jgi:1-acyl-sn-glycerol-3-phosphate acyltransferase
MIESLVLGSWLAFWGSMRRYHRFAVDGFEHLAAPGPALLVAYHARGFAVDVCILSVEMHERLGYFPHAIFHEGIGRLPILRTMLRALGGVAGDHATLSEAVARGEHVIVLPGGGREAFRSACRRYRVDWGNRMGYLRLALRLGVPIIPIASRGVDSLYLGLNDGYRLGKRLGAPLKLPCWVATGATGLFPLSLPYPVRLRQRIGPRIHLDADGPVDPRDGERLLALHRMVAARVQALLDRPHRRTADAA